MRLFVAVNLPDEERRTAHAALAPLRSAGLPVRWMAPEALHVTLQFLGAADPAAVAGIGVALSRAVAGARPFAVTVGGIGAFPDLAAARIVWLGVERHPALELLADDVARALAPLGFAPELRPFTPHVTVGRARRDAGTAALRGLEAAAREVDYAAVVPVAGVDLMESVTGREGAVYRLLHRAPLRAGE